MLPTTRTLAASVDDARPDTIAFARHFEQGGTDDAVYRPYVRHGLRQRENVAPRDLRQPADPRADITRENWGVAVRIRCDG